MKTKKSILAVTALVMLMVMTLVLVKLQVSGADDGQTYASDCPWIFTASAEDDLEVACDVPWIFTA